MLYLNTNKPIFLCLWCEFRSACLLYFIKGWNSQMAQGSEYGCNMSSGIQTQWNGEITLFCDKDRRWLRYMSWLNRKWVPDLNFPVLRSHFSWNFLTITLMDALPASHLELCWFRRPRFQTMLYDSRTLYWISFSNFNEISFWNHSLGPLDKSFWWLI